jgi:hypothetical protein
MGEQRGVNIDAASAMLVARDESGAKKAIRTIV